MKRRLEMGGKLAKESRLKLLSFNKRDEEVCV